MIQLLFLTLFPFAIFASPDTTKINNVKQFMEQTDNRSEYAILIDLSIPSNEKRLFLVQVQTKKILYTTYVAHGKGSGTGTQAVHFSDSPGGLCTTLGYFKIGKNYQGKHGNSYELIGLEKNNANAQRRSVVIHSAWYVNENFIRQNGRCGNSWGCPAISAEALKELAPYLSPGIILWIYK